MSQKYKRAKKARSNKITFEQQVIDEEREKVELRKSVWTDDFEIGGAL